MVECKGFGIVGIVELDELDLVVFLIGLDDSLTISILLFGVHRSNPDYYFNCLAHFVLFFNGRSLIELYYIQSRIRIYRI